MATSSREVVQISSYSRKLKDNVKSIMDNYGEILKAAKVETSGRSPLDAQMFHVENEIQVRAANIVRAASSLYQLVSELKEYLLLNDFTAINESVTQRSQYFEQQEAKIKEEMKKLYDDYRQHVPQSSQGETSQ